MIVPYISLGEELCVCREACGSLIIVNWLHVDFLLLFTLKVVFCSFRFFINNVFF